MDKSRYLISRLALRLAQYCDALGYSEEDEDILTSVNDYLGYEHVVLAGEVPLTMPERAYQYLIEVQFRPRSRLKQWIGTLFGHTMRSELGDEEGMDGLHYAWEPDGCAEGRMETPRKGASLRRTLRVTSCVPMDGHLASQIARMACSGESHYEVDVLWFSRLLAEAD